MAAAKPGVCGDYTIGHGWRDAPVPSGAKGLRNVVLPAGRGAINIAWVIIRVI
jgi:hypothetical protein